MTQVFYGVMYIYAHLTLSMEIRLPSKVGKEDQIQIQQEDQIQQEEEEAASPSVLARKDQASPLYGDLLEAIFSHVPLIDLVPASYVSKSWRRTVSSCIRNQTRPKPWLIIHIQSPWKPSATVACAYDPNSHVWIEIKGAATSYESPLRSSHSSSLYMLTPSRLAFSFDPLNDEWYNVSGPQVWRTNPVVAVIGSSQVVVAGGTCDFQHDPLAVEIFNMDTQRWEMCQPMPTILEGSAANTWLSVAVSGQELYLLEKCSGTFCSFDPRTKTWSRTLDLRPNPSIYFSVIGYSGDRLILVGLTGEKAENTEGLMLWEVNLDTFDCTEIGDMPAPLLQKLKNPDLPLLSVDISVVSNFIYIYDSSDPKEIFFCDFKSGNCEWGSIMNPFSNDRSRMHRFVFTCSRVGINELQKVYLSGNREFMVK